MNSGQTETFGGVPAWLLREYLGVLGGREAGDGRFEGEGWSAAVEPVPRPEGSHAIGRVVVRIDGPEAERVMEALRWKALRGGG